MLTPSASIAARRSAARAASLEPIRRDRGQLAAFLRTAIAARLEPIPGAAPKAPVVIVGTGPVGVRVARLLHERSPEQSIVSYGDEPWEPYDRVRLSSVLAGEIRQDEVVGPRDRVVPDHFVTHLNCRVVAIDREAKVVVDALGRVQAYEKLILATGSRPYVPSIPGIDLPRAWGTPSRTTSGRPGRRRARPWLG